MDLAFLHIMIINIPGIINNIKKNLCELINKVLKSINFKLITDNFNYYFLLLMMMKMTRAIIKDHNVCGQLTFALIWKA